jgi:hypothetical protein
MTFFDYLFWNNFANKKEGEIMQTPQWLIDEMKEWLKAKK